MLTHKKHINWPVLGICAILVSGCAGGEYINPDSPEYTRFIERQIIQAQDNSELNIYQISLDDAIELGLQQNLDLRLAALETMAAGDNVSLEKLQAFPTVQAKANYIGRSNEGASSSRSVSTGTESLEPSISTEPHRRTMELETSWNLLDVALTVFRSKTASDREKIAALQQQKVAQDLTRDIIIAYYRALTAQENLDEIQTLRSRANQHLKNIQIALDDRLISGQDALQKQENVLNGLNKLSSITKDLTQADLELKQLLNLSPDTQLKLISSKRITNLKRQLPVSDEISKLEQYALLHRPELQEQVLNKNIALRNKRLAIIETFPGAELLYTYNYDSNKFLEEERWFSTTTSLVQSITQIFTLPVRYKAAQTQEEIEGERIKSLTAIIMAQINISKRLVDLEEENYKLFEHQNSITSQKTKIAQIMSEDGIGTHDDYMSSSLDAQISKIEKDMAYVELQSAYARLLNALGTTLL